MLSPDCPSEPPWKLQIYLTEHGASVDEETENKSTRAGNAVYRVGCHRISLLRHILRSGCELQVSIRTPLHPSNVKPAKELRSGSFDPKGVAEGRGRPVTDKTFLVRFKLATYLSPRPVLAARAEIRGEHLALLNSEGELAALFLLEVVESWSEVKWNA
jgi:hypothetical protein